MILSEIFTSYSNEKKAKIAFKKLRDEQGVTCKKCQSLHHYWKADKNDAQNTDNNGTAG
jgi:hypothetical protein